LVRYPNTLTQQPSLHCFYRSSGPTSSIFFSFTGPPPTTIYTLSLHDALPIFARCEPIGRIRLHLRRIASILSQISAAMSGPPKLDRKSTRLNSSHLVISYAVFCLKKKNLIDLKNNFGTACLRSIRLPFSKTEQ